MSAPRREHVDAVARAIRNHLGAGWNSSSLAKDILTSTDPAVHAAMLDALVRAGYLDKATDLVLAATNLARVSTASVPDAVEALAAAMRAVIDDD